MLVTTETLTTAARRVHKRAGVWLAPLLVFIFVAGIEAQAKTIYVSLSGRDSNSGAINQPVATPKRALAMAAPGDTIQLRAGRYTLTNLIWIDKANLTIASYPGERAALVGSTTDEENMPMVIAINSSNVSLVNLEIEGGAYYGVKASSDTPISNVQIKGCRIHRTGRDSIKTFNVDNLLIEDCEVGPSGVRDASNAEGIDVMSSVGVTIRRCYVHDTGTSGIYLKGGARDAVIEGCRVERAGHSGILLGQDSDAEFMRDGASHEAINCVARNNVIISTGGGGLGTFSGSNIRFENNTLVDVAKSYNGGFYVVTNSRGVPARQVTFKNNIVVMNGERPLILIKNLEDQINSDSNIWFKPSGGSYKFWRESSARGDNYWESFARWQAGMKADSRSIIADPALDLSKLYKPLPNSPAVDRGEALAEVRTDYSGIARPQGRAYDIGAHESLATSAANASQPGAAHSDQINDAEARPWAGSEAAVWIAIFILSVCGAAMLLAWPLKSSMVL